MTHDEIAAALARLAGGGQVTELTRLSAGASLETWSFKAGGTPLILRRRDTVSGERRSFSTSIPLTSEAMLLAAAAKARVPVASMIHVCTAKDGLGEAYIVSFVAGETRGRRIVSDERFAGVRPLMAEQCGRILARIHTIPGNAAPLAVSDAIGEIERYEKIYRQLGGDRPILELGFRLLKKRAPPCPNPVTLHGDFRTGNLMVAPELGVAAVLDWELSHRGDPAEDLGWLCVNSWRFGAAEKAVGGFGDYGTLLDAYENESGRAIAFEHLLYWQAVGSLKWAVMTKMMVAAHRNGEGASLERLMIGRRTSEAELDLVLLLEALR